LSQKPNDGHELLWQLIGWFLAGFATWLALVSIATTLQ
jgi:hypothetical protein